MKFIIKLSPEIFVKSQSVRLRFIKILTGNIRKILRFYEKILIIIRYWDHIEVIVKDEEQYLIQYQMICNLLTRIPGIHHILEVEDIPYISLHYMLEKVLMRYQSKIEGKTFCVRVKRRGKHPFTSMEVEQYLGKELNQRVNSSKVKLYRPDITINLEIENDRFLIVKHRYKGVGGFPIGTQGDVLSLISGGFDSSVSSYMLMRRGCRVHYCFFNLGGTMHESEVFQVAYYLWNRFGNSHRVRMISINFKPIVDEILKKISDGYTGIILKRAMVRVASKLAKKYKVPALVTGESIGQVSSQTLNNLHLIDSVSDVLILRPLISYDKEYIINMAREIGTENFSRTVPEYCGIISKSPIVKARQLKIEMEENDLDLSILDRIIKKANNIDISKIPFKIKERTESSSLEVVNGFGINDIILDIRHIDDQNNKPLKIEGVKVISLPFYNLSRKFGDLDQSKTWLLWCEKGIMSRIQALYLLEQGFKNVKVYRP